MLTFDEAIAAQSKADREKHERIYGWTYTDTEHDYEYYRSLYLSDKQRPDWDIPVWESIGSKVSVERDVSALIWDEGQLLMYTTTPMFMVKAEK